MARHTRRTVLICCEGKADRAFLLHLRGLYCAGRDNPPNVTPKQAGGKGGNNVVATLVGSSKNAAYDALVALVDADVPPQGKALKDVERYKVIVVTVSPCLEGLLLKLLGQAVPVLSADCKSRLKAIDPRDPFADGFFAARWPKALLEEKRLAIAELDALLKCFD